MESQKFRMFFALKYRQELNVYIRVCQIWTFLGGKIELVFDMSETHTKVLGALRARLL